jgi:hypothetical protein
MLKVQNEESLLRDPHSHAIINSNLQEMTKFKRERDNQHLVHSLKNDVSHLQSEMSDIKSMLNMIINKL